MKNIFLVGKAGSGKTTLCNYLVEDEGHVLAKMAYPVYDIAKRYLGMKEKDRYLLQYLGTDVGRKEIDSDIWVNRFCDDIYIAQKVAKNMCNKELIFCCDDVRFQNEADVLYDDGWHGIYLSSDYDVRVKRLKNRDGNAQEETLDHESETEIDKFKDNLVHVDTNGSIEESINNLKNILKEIKNGRSTR